MHPFNEDLIMDLNNELSLKQNLQQNLDFKFLNSELKDFIV